MKTRTRFSTMAAGVAVAAALLSSCGDDKVFDGAADPEAVVVMYFQLFAAGDNDRACSLVAASAAAELNGAVGGGDCVSSLEQLREMAGPDRLSAFNDTAIRQVSYEVAGVYAEISDDDIFFGRVAAAETDYDSAPLTLDMYDGKWLISSFG